MYAQFRRDRPGLRLVQFGCPGRQPRRWCTAASTATPACASNTGTDLRFLEPISPASRLSEQLISNFSPLMRVSLTSSGWPAGLLARRTIRSSATPGANPSLLASAGDGGRVVMAWAKPPRPG